MSCSPARAPGMMPIIFVRSARACGITVLQSALLFDFQVLGLLSGYLSGNVLEVGDSRIEFSESAWDNVDNTLHVGDPLWDFYSPVSSAIRLPSFRSTFQLPQR
jgi:hypothetical protein